MGDARMKSDKTKNWVHLNVNYDGKELVYETNAERGLIVKLYESSESFSTLKTRLRDLGYQVNEYVPELQLHFK